MSAFKSPKIGNYQSKDRALQKRLSYEKTSLTWHPINVYRYLGDLTLGTGSDISDIQDSLFMENTDRRYDSSPVLINASIDPLQEQPFDLGKFGIMPVLADTIVFRIHVNSFEADGLGRYIVVGDVIEVPFYEDNGNDSKKAFFEVTDTDRKMEFENFYITVTTVPVKDSQEFQDIDGFETNSDALDDLQAQLDNVFNEDYTQEGLSPEPSLFTERGFVVAGFWDVASTNTYTDDDVRVDYNPVPNNDWLDGEEF